MAKKKSLKKKKFHEDFFLDQDTLVPNASNKVYSCLLVKFSVVWNECYITAYCHFLMNVDTCTHDDDNAKYFSTKEAKRQLCEQYTYNTICGRLQSKSCCIQRPVQTLTCSGWLISSHELLVFYIITHGRRTGSVGRGWTTDGPAGGKGQNI